MTYPETIIFDLDGTLIHSAPDLQAAMNVALSSLGREQLDLATVISFIGNGVEVLVERSLRATGKISSEIHRSALAAFLESYSQNMTALTRPYPGVIACLEALKSADVRLGICTNKPTGPAKDICDQLDLSRFFDVIAGAEPDQPKKPDATPLLACIGAMGGTVPNALYVGDSTVDYQTAKNADVSFRLYSRGYLNAGISDLAAEYRFDDWTHENFLKS